MEYFLILGRLGFASVKLYYSLACSMSRQGYQIDIGLLMVEQFPSPHSIRLMVWQHYNLAQPKRALVKKSLRQRRGEIRTKIVG